MIEPHDLLRGRQPRTVSMPGLHAHTGLWAQAIGVLRPAVFVDRMIEGRPGFEALMFHEALHVHEHHALAGLVVLGFGFLGASLSLVAENLAGFLSCLALGAVAWASWRREQEIRCDAFALRGACSEFDPETKAWRVTPESEKKGLAEFRAFTLLHEHPTRWFWKFAYGGTPRRRIARALARARRIRWVAA